MTHIDPPDSEAVLTELMRHEHVPPRRDRVDPKPRRRRRLVALTTVALVLLVSGGYVVWALTAPLSNPQVTWAVPEVSVPAAASVALPAEGASAISISGADDYLGAAASGIWATSGSNDPRPIASISKLITALVILDAKPLSTADDPGPTITFSKADHDLYDKYYSLDATIAEMPTGSSMSQHDALATMLIPSACNYAEALANWAFGSQHNFLDATEAWLSAHGLSGTTIVEPTGVSEQNTSTPSDLIAIGKLAAANPAIAQIAATRSLNLPGPGVIGNTNDLLGSSGITGLKTGNLGEDSYNLLYTASVDVGAAQPLSIVGVLLGGHSRQSVDDDVTALLASISAGFHRVNLVTDGDEVGSYSTRWGSTVRMVAVDTVSILTWSDTPITVATQTATPTVVRSGEAAGSITWTAGPNTETTSVTLDGDITPPSAWWRLTHPFELG